jgi:hypothetical protein
MNKRVVGKTFTGAVAVKGLSCLLVLAALVACSGANGNSSTHAQTQTQTPTPTPTPTPPSASSFLVDCQGKTGVPPTQPPTFTTSFLSDAGVHVPPTTGPYAYNTFMPGTNGFPAVGETYIDPIFGGTVRRLTDTVGFPNQEDIYAHHWANANGTLAFSTQQIDDQGTTILKIISTTTGAPVYTDQPLGSSKYDIAWDAIDPNRYYYYEGADLTCWNLSEHRKVAKTFPSPLQANGGSLNTQDRSGRYFTVRYLNTNGVSTNKVWDSQTDIIYTGEVTPLSSGGWVAITPDGNYLVTAAGLNNEHYSYAIDHIKHSISSTPVNFWTQCGDHGVLVSATNKRNYFITFDCDRIPGIYRVDITLNWPDDITLDQAGKIKNETNQVAANQILLPLSFGTATTASTNDGHLSAVSKGPNQNWVFFDSETSLDYDPFDSVPTNWQPYEQEIIAMNVLTSEVRRYGHHRSRGLITSKYRGGYYAQPRISCSWDGSIILWTSNYNRQLLPEYDYADLYGMAFSGN